MSSKPRISVVVPTYNREDLVRHCIHGILDQSFTDWELIIVDDGSTDKTEFECKRFSTIDPRIKYYKIPHSGHIGYVRNYGNSLAVGELIVVQDSDDISLPDRLEVIWNEYQRTKADVLYHGTYQCFPVERLNITLRQYKKALPYSLEELMHTQYIPAQVAVTREAALKIPYDPKIHVSDDWLWLMELALNGYTFHPIDQALYEYYHSEDSANIIGEKDGRRTQDMKHILTILREKYEIDVISSETKDYQGNTKRIIT